MFPSNTSKLPSSQIIVLVIMYIYYTI